MKIYIHSKNKPLYRHGNPSTYEYIWVSPNKNTALRYGQQKHLISHGLSQLKNNQINRYFSTHRNIVEKIKQNINSHTKIYPRNLKLVNLRNKNTMNYLLNQLKPSLKTRLMSNNYIRYTGNTVHRKSNFTKDVILANLITSLKKNYRFNINGFYNKGNRINEEIVIFNSNMPRRLNARRVNTRVVKDGGPIPFNVWKQRRNNKKRQSNTRSAYNVFSSMRQQPQIVQQPRSLPQPVKKRPRQNNMNQQKRQRPTIKSQLLSFTNENN